jgi:hypothetical protein
MGDIVSRSCVERKDLIAEVALRKKSASAPR